MGKFLSKSVLCLWIVLAMVLPGDASAQPTDKATAFIDGIGKDVMAVLNNAALSGSQKDSELQQLFQKTVDVDWIGKFVLGKYWRTATPAQQSRYSDSYRVFVIKSYTSKFSEYTGGETYKIVSSKADGEGKYLVTMQIVRKKEAPVMIDYKLRDSEGGQLKVYDIVVEGVSLLTTQRSEFASVVSRKGLDYLIDQLEARAKS